MTSVAASQYRPGRALGVLAAILLALAVWILWPFSDAAKTPSLGLDLRGGTSVTLVPKPVQGDIIQEQIDQAVSIIRQRVDSLGVAEAEVTTQGNGNNAVIIVAIPGANQKRIVELVGQTAQLNFRPVIAESGGGPATPAATTAPGTRATPAPTSTGSGRAITKNLVAPRAATATPTPTPKATPKPAAPNPLALPIQSPDLSPAFQAKFGALDCTQDANRVSTKPDVPDELLITCSQDGNAKYLLDKTAVQGTNIDGATAGLRQGGVGEWVVNLDFDGEGTRLFSTTTQGLVSQQPPQNQFAIVLDGLVVSAPAVNEAITGGSAEISGSFTQESANDLANVLKFGALPVAFEIAEVNSVSATLGQDQLNAGLIAGGLGLLLVVLYLLLYYRALGLVAVSSLLVAAGITYAAFVLLSRTVGFTLTLAGVAGAIVAIGITADSFIVYFERIRDEVRDRKSLRVACETGWVRARRTILAADFVSLLAAGVLYFVSVGNVRGFAFVLGLTTLIDILVVFLFTRPLVTLLGRQPFFTNGHPLSGLDPARLGVAPAVESTPNPRKAAAAATPEEA